MGNIERLRQAYYLRGTIGLIRRDLMGLGDIFQGHQIDQARVTSLEGFLTDLDPTRTTLHPDYIIYFVDNIAAGCRTS